MAVPPSDLRRTEGARRRGLQQVDRPRARGPQRRWSRACGTIGGRDRIRGLLGEGGMARLADVEGNEF